MTKRVSVGKECILGEKTGPGRQREKGPAGRGRGTESVADAKDGGRNRRENGKVTFTDPDATHPCTLSKQKAKPVYWRGGRKGPGRGSVVRSLNKKGRTQPRRRQGESPDNFIYLKGKDKKKYIGDGSVLVRMGESAIS